ncbi:stress responsive protein [Rhodothalassium salexigens]|uniref:Stress responsive alpha/beta barrel protein n=1 Tax=Rhodothalassium salexigens DSM 2132 TaxID=1188247 RepID=A0A4R2PBN9_RHOSA|nr:Dabb family protein [Rhodothalassium salexigens]MBB4212310.1 hypothetical protein [Rhodothalassium salexigens DSM 2132]MBK1638810.1 stress responsive protein [Rhodothalassium salexigens DSM 2132]MBK5910479.1 stress responsive protein [Rhodothalassium salexigens]MBK5921703.1 stress responsive protein [Rhodothalassium salexigens]TCP32539.1 stress responsive alpha/beta barrel protein [Rhodothalassium salexigens DSM 2132]
MIRHIVFFTAKDRAHLGRIMDDLSRLGTIEPVRHLEVVQNEKRDLWHNEIDVVVYAEFDDLASLDRYKADPLYEEITARVRPLRDLRMSADIRAVD